MLDLAVPFKYLYTRIQLYCIENIFCIISSLKILHFLAYYWVIFLKSVWCALEEKDRFLVMGQRASAISKMSAFLFVWFCFVSVEVESCSVITARVQWHNNDGVSPEPQPPRSSLKHSYHLDLSNYWDYRCDHCAQYHFLTYICFTLSVCLLPLGY